MTTQEYARPDLLVETDWLEAHLDDPNIRIVDCDQFDLYQRAHIKNALGIRVHHYIKQPEYATDPRKYPLVAPPDVFSELMGSMGIGNDSLVVTYDNAGSLSATRFWWVLNYYGHTNVKVLNGGWRKWFDEGRPITLDSPEIKTSTFTPDENHNLVCTLDYGVSQVGNPDTIFLTCAPTASGKAPTTEETSDRDTSPKPSTWNGSTSSPTTNIAPSRPPASCAPCWRSAALPRTNRSSPIDRAASVRRTDSSSWP